MVLSPFWAAAICAQHFMEHEGSLSCSREPSTGPCPEPDKSSPYHPTLFSKIHFNIVTCMGDSRRGFGLDIAFIDHLLIVTTSNYNSLTGLHTPNITRTTEQTKSSLHSLTFNWLAPRQSQRYFQLSTGRLVKVKVTLWLAVYRQSVPLDVKALETHDQRFSPPPPNEPLQ
jgi:hypothetical protein